MLLVNVVRLERCNLCFPELEKVKRFLPSLSRYQFNFIFWLEWKKNVYLFKPDLAMLVWLELIVCCLFTCRRGGSVAKSAHELNLALQDVS